MFRMFLGVTPEKFISYCKRVFLGMCMPKQGYKSVTVSEDVYFMLEGIRKRMKRRVNHVSLNDVVKMLVKMYSCVTPEDDLYDEKRSENS